MYPRHMNISALCVALFFLFSFLYAAPQGKIEGWVVDSQNGEALPGANVFIEGTSFGSSTDLDGKFTIVNIPVGSHQLVVTYIGYQKKSLDVTITAGETLKQVVELNYQAIEGEVIEVTAQAAGQMQAINQQLASDKIASIVSEARIQELPDFNAAQAISRLPGVSTLESSGEANKIVIRGLAPQFNTVSVEGVKLASTGSAQMGVSTLGNTNMSGTGDGSITNDRSVDLTMVSPYMIKSISVFKSLTPDMDANSIGGSVNMELREAPSEMHYDFLWQSGYTAKTENYGNYRMVASGSQRFLQDKIGVYLLGNLEKYDRDADNMSASYRTTDKIPDSTTGYRPVMVRNVPLNRHIETRKRYGGNVILDYRLGSGSIKSVNMFTRLDSDFKENQTTLNYNDKLLNFNYREGTNTTDMMVNSLDFKYDFGRMLMDMKFSHTSSKNELPESPFVQFKTGQVTTGAVEENMIPDSLKKLWAYPGPEEVYLDNLNLFSSVYKESNNTFSSDFKFPFNLGSFVSGYLKIGGKARHQANSNDQKTPYAGMAATGIFNRDMVLDVADHFNLELDPSTSKFTASSFMGDPKLWDPFLNNQFGEIYWACDPSLLVQMARYLNNSPQWSGRATGGSDQTGGWYHGIFQSLANSYEYSEDFYAAYLMSELKYRNVMVVGGVRYEKTQSEYTAYNMYDMRNPDTQECDTVITHPENEFWLPMAQVKYSPFDWFDVRYAYTQTLARPDYHQMSPKLNYDNPRKNIRAGNPDLVPAQAFSHDLNLTFHGNKLGLFSVGAFYKTIKDFTYYTQYILHENAVSEDIKTYKDFEIMGVRPEDGATLYTYINSPYPAYVKGWEVDFQTRFWYLPYHLDGIVFGINYTKIKSEATYPLRDEVTVYPPRPAQPITTTYDSTRSGRLIFQPNDVMNAYIGYEYKGFSARMSFVFQGNSVSGIGAFPVQDGYTRDYFRMDASVRQKLPYYGMEVYLDVNNLNSEKNEAAQRSIDGFTSVKHYGMTANLGIRFRY